MQLYYIRHAQSTNNLLWQETGSSVGRSEDPPLTEMGKKQAELLAHALTRANPDLPITDNQQQNVSGFGITHLYSSLMSRSLETGLAISKVLGIPLLGWKDLHESGGIYLEDEGTGERVGLAGKSRSALLSEFPGLLLSDDIDDEGWWNRPFEEKEERRPRAQRVLSELLARHGGTEDRVAIISHGGFYYYFLSVLFNLPEQHPFWFALNNVAISRIDFLEEGMGIVYLNRLDFLPPELIT